VPGPGGRCSATSEAADLDELDAERLDLRRDHLLVPNSPVGDHRFLGSDPGAPRFLGVDDRGREILSFIAGQAAVAPFADRVLSDDALVSVAELLRAYHEAIASFDPAGYAWPPAVPAAFRTSTVSHNDPNLDNVVFSEGRAVALVDFDLAGPGSAVLGRSLRAGAPVGSAP